MHTSSYIVAQCRCGHIQGLMNNETKRTALKCQKCGKSSKIWDNRKGGLNLNVWGLDKGWGCTFASKMVGQIKEEQAMKNE